MGRFKGIARFFRGVCWMNKMSVNRGQAAWGFPPENKFRRGDGLPRMMAASIAIHLSFIVFIMVGERWAVRQPPLQSYQVNLVSPSAGLSLPSRITTPGKRVRSAAAPASSTPQAVRVSRPARAPKPPVKAVLPATRRPASPSSEIKPPSSQASGPAAVPRTSLKVPRNADDDPERLEEWWKKKVGSMKTPSASALARAKRSLTPPQKKTEKIEIGQNAPKIQIGRRLAPVFPHPQGESSRSADASQIQSNPILPVEEGGAGSALPEGLNGSSSLARTNPGQTGMTRQSSIAGGGGISGSADVIGGRAGGTGNARLRFPGYLQKMENKISGTWAPPPVSSQGEPASVTIGFNVMKNGQVEPESIQVEKSSGNKQFDEAAMRAVWGAKPFPPFPESLSEDRLSIHFNFTMLENS